MEVDLNRVPKLCCELAAMHYELETINPKIERKGVMAVIIPLMLAGFCCLLVVGCGGTEVVSPEIMEKAADLSSATSLRSAIDAQAKAVATTLAAQKLTGEMTLENTHAIMDKLNKLEASLAKSEPQTGKDGDPASAPSPPAKANDTQTPIKVATPGAFRTASDGTRLRWNIEGNWNPTILETSAHLGREHGIDTDGMTHQQMADLHADLHDGKATPVSAVRVKNASPVSSCPGGVCPTNRSQRRRGGLFSGLFR